MPYCPRCYTEYVEGTSDCEDCRIPLQPGSPPERPAAAAASELLRGARLVRVHTFTGPTGLLDAEMARNILEEQGIPSFVPGATSLELLPVLDVPLLVREQDVAKAEATLKGYFDAPSPDPAE